MGGKIYDVVWVSIHTTCGMAQQLCMKLNLQVYINRYACTKVWAMS